MNTNLPTSCLTFLTTSGEPIVIYQGESGYHPVSTHAYNRIMGYGRTVEEAVDRFNASNGVTKAQRSAMEHGSMFGWDSPLTDPEEAFNKRQGDTAVYVELIDDGTMDTVLKCQGCGEEFRFTFAMYDGDEADEDVMAYENFVWDCIEEIEGEHECGGEI